MELKEEAGETNTFLFNVINYGGYASGSLKDMDMDIDKDMA
jgi:hypothetical protein